MKLFMIALVALSALLSASAYAAEFHPSTYTTYKKHGPYGGTVGVLNDLPAVGSYTEIGIVRVPTGDVSDYYTALDDLKKAAAEHGGTAIVLQPDAKLFAEGKNTDNGTPPHYATAIAIIQ